MNNPKETLRALIALGNMILAQYGGDANQQTADQQDQGGETVDGSFVEPEPTHPGEVLPFRAEIEGETTSGRPAGSGDDWKPEEDTGPKAEELTEDEIDTRPAGSGKSAGKVPELYKKPAPTVRKPAADEKKKPNRPIPPRKGNQPPAQKTKESNRAYEALRRNEAEAARLLLQEDIAKAILNHGKH
jgi:hypothetical protein